MYLTRNDPFSAHTQAMRHLLHRAARNGQLAMPSRFSLWRMIHYRLQAWQTLARERPDAQQIAWLYTLHNEPDDLRICSHVLHMTIYSAACKTLTQSPGQRYGDATVRTVKLEQADKLAGEMQNLLGVVERWDPEMARLWNAREEDAAGDPELDGSHSDGPPWFPAPRVPYQGVLTYDDLWLVKS